MASFVTEFKHLEIQLEDIIISATNNFDESKVIGRGGFGNVYAGELSLSQSGEKSLVAIKRLDRKYGQGDPEFFKEGFKIYKDSGKICCMLGTKDMSIAWHDDTRYWERGHVPESRFAEVAILRWVSWLDICGIIPSVILSPKSTYVAYLVFKITRDSSGLDVPAKTTVSFGGIRNETSNVYLKQPQSWASYEAPTHVSATTRNDGWMEIKLGEFYRDHGDEGEVELKFQEHHFRKEGLIVEGIELRPK